jgi:hypothetical protein
MPHVAPATLLARIQNLENQLNNCQYPTDFSGNLNSSWPVMNGSVPYDVPDTSQYGYNSSHAMPGGATNQMYAFYSPMSDGSMHISLICKNAGSNGGSGWWQLTGSTTPLPFAPLAVKFFPAFCDELQTPSGGSYPMGCTGAMDTGGNLWIFGQSAGATYVGFDTCVPLLW